MNALADFESYWRATCAAAGGHIQENGSLILRHPRAGPPVNGIFRAEGLDLEGEIVRWKADGAPFSVLATTDQEAMVAAELGLKHHTFALIEGPVTDLGEPAHHILEGSVEDFVHVQMETHDIPRHARSMLIQNWRRRLEEGNVHLFIAWNQGPAGCAALYTGNGNAGLYAFGVRDEFRRTGVGTALMQACMKRAIELGLTTAVGATTPDGLALAKSIGMAPMREIKQFVWMPQS